MKKLNLLLATFSMIGCLAMSSVHADVIIGTDFEGSIPAAGTPTLGNITFEVDGVTTGDSLTAVSTGIGANNAGGQSGNVNTSADAVGYFALANNIGNGGVWSTSLDFTTGADVVDATDLDIAVSFFGNTFNFNAGSHNANLSVDILDSLGSSVIGGPVSQLTSPLLVSTGGATVGTNLDFADVSLAAGSDFTLVLGFVGGTAGNNIGIDSFALNNTVAAPEPSPVPEPSSIALLGLGCIALVGRRRK